MTKTEIEEYLLRLEHKLLVESERKTIELNMDWANSFPNLSAVYLIREEGEICYVGESGNIGGLLSEILNTKYHTVRKQGGQNHYSKPLPLNKATLKDSLANVFEQMLSDNIEKQLAFSYIPVNLGRKELEERLYAKLTPKYNLKNRFGSGKAYSKADKQAENKNAYEKWTPESDGELEKLFCEGKTIVELSEIFARNNGAIRARIKKLELREKYSE